MNALLTRTVAAAAFFAVAGCFYEPEPAYKTAPEGSVVYLQERGFADFASAVTNLDAKVVTYLNLDRNAITNLDGVAAFSELKWLRLNGNRLSALPSLVPLKSLRRIYLRDNAFTSLPEQLKDLPALTSLDMSGNPVTEIPDWLAKKEGLEFLSFSRTRLTRLPEDLSAWKSLSALQLGALSLSKEEMARIREALSDVAIVF